MCKNIYDLPLFYNKAIENSIRNDFQQKWNVLNVQLVFISQYEMK